MDHADPQDVAEVATAWDDDMLECRRGRHDFGPSSRLDARFNNQDGTFVCISRCPRCYVEEHVELVEFSGEVVSRRLDYRNAKEGYLFPKGTGRATITSRNAIRREWIARQRRALMPKRPRRRRARKAA